MLSAGDLIDLSIDSVAYRGQGVARHEGLVLFVTGVAPGERVRVRVTKLRRNFAEAQLLAVLASSPDRIPPCCRLPNGTRVPGCVYDHLAYPAEVALKQRQAGEFLRRLPGGDALAFAPPVPSPLERHYRNKIVLHAQRTPRDRVPRLGYFGEDNRTVIDIPACPLARSEINAALADFRKPGTLRSLQNGETVTFRWTAMNGVIGWRGETPPHDGSMTEAAPFGAVRVPADGFYQANPEVAAELVRQVVAWFRAGDDLLDLYCGVGVFAIACARAGARQVTGIESGRMAVAAANENARSHGVQATFLCRTLSEAARDAFGGFEMAQATVIVDPPRQGLEPEVTQALATARPQRILYVSCDPATLTRDLKALLPAGYALRAARAFDMFPRTAHVETVVRLERQG
jgi:23S rRNA (uracil1939-C5)-methyltransferase